MTSNSIYIPETIKVGFQKRDDTYTKQLGYVIYYDAKGKLRKETSWESWRQKNIKPLECKNEPTSGFVLNKKAGGYSTGWDVRQTYSRIFDPRGFEFEITIPNLLYILENTDCLKGKGLSGEFVYGWDGTELLLIPTSAPEYANMVDYSNLIAASAIKAKDLILGGTYLTNKNQKVIYLGKYDCWSQYYSWDEKDEYNQKHRGKQFYFQTACTWREVITRSSVSGYLIQCVSDTPVENYASIMSKLEGNPIFSPVDKTKDEYLPVTIKDLKKDLKCYFKYEGKEWTADISVKHIGKTNPMYFRLVKDDYGYSWYTKRQPLEDMAKDLRTAEDVVTLANQLGFKYRKRYLQNGKVKVER